MKIASEAELLEAMKERRVCHHVRERVGIVHERLSSGLEEAKFVKCYLCCKKWRIMKGGHLVMRVHGPWQIIKHD